MTVKLCELLNICDVIKLCNVGIAGVTIDDLGDKALRITGEGTGSNRPKS